jgi:hypothetical protein
MSVFVPHMTMHLDGLMPNYMYNVTLHTLSQEYK